MTTRSSETCQSAGPCIAGVPFFEFDQWHASAPERLANYEQFYKPWSSLVQAWPIAVAARLSVGNELKPEAPPQRISSIRHSWYLSFTRDIVDTIRRAIDTT